MGMRRIALLLTAAMGAAALLALFYPSMVVHAADVATSVEGENFDIKPTGTSVVGNTTLYSNGQALKFSNSTAIAKETVNFTSSGDVVLRARAEQSGGSPTLRVSVNGNFTAPARAITNSGAPEPYTFDVNAPSGRVTIGVQAGNTATGRKPFLDVVQFPGSAGAADTTPPTTTITGGPAAGSTDTDGNVTFTYSATDNVRVEGFDYRLINRTQYPTYGQFDPEWQSGELGSSGSKTFSNLSNGQYTFEVIARDAAQNYTYPWPSRTFTVNTTSGGTTSAVLVGAGDISSGGSRDQETGDLVRAQLAGGAWGVFTTGDNAYPDGTYDNYRTYHAAWGSFRNKTRPTYGNHDYYGSYTAVGSEDYWNDPDPTPVRVSNATSFYAYDVGSSNWRAIVLNSVSTEGPSGNQAPSCAAGSPQMNFLNNELNTTKNTVLFWHHARFSASTDHPTSEGATGCSKTFFDVAYDKRADLVLQGHSHLYERYDTRDKSGTKVAGGLTSIVCGTGGNSFDGLQGSPSPAPDRAFTNAWGVCKLTLNANNAQVAFLPAPGSPGTDSATVAVRP
jgi:Calcineurin-like phosphoesterase